VRALRDCLAVRVNPIVGRSESSTRRANVILSEKEFPLFPLQNKFNLTFADRRHIIRIVNSF
jgi:hypothetical protein